MSNYFIYKDNLVIGPLPENALRKMYATGSVFSDTPCKTSDPNTPWGQVEDFLTTQPQPQPEVATPANILLNAKVLDVTSPSEASVACPYCAQEYTVDPNEYAGSEVICTNCQKHFVIPVNFQTAGSASAAKAQQPAVQPYSPADALAEEVPDGALLCPHCWKSFDTDNLLYIAVHPSLVGDPVLGEFVQQRFQPSTFNALGQPLDDRGLPATDTACPRCHLEYPMGMVDCPSIYFSIAGATSSGKSYFLTCMIHQLRKILPKFFDLGFFDLSPKMNDTLVHYENQLFMAPDADAITALPATQISGSGISDRVLLNGVEIELPKPFVFACRSGAKDAKETCMVFYDNSGEMFIPGRDEWVNQATFHLSHSNGIMFLFDPTNDANMQKQLCDSRDPQVSKRARVADQQILFSEMISRIRRHANMTSDERCDIPLIVAIGKYDTWKDHFKKNLQEIAPIVQDPNGLGYSLDLDAIADVSFAVRELMLQYVPTLVDTAERFFRKVFFVPVSAFGTMAEMDERGSIGVRPAKIAPIWLEVPSLLLMAQNGLLSYAERKRDGLGTQDFTVRWQGDQIAFRHPTTGEIVRLPANYAGRRLTIDGKFYDLPAQTNGGQARSTVQSHWD